MNNFSLEFDQAQLQEIEKKQLIRKRDIKQNKKLRYYMHVVEPDVHKIKHILEKKIKKNTEELQTVERFISIIKENQVTLAKFNDFESNCQITEELLTDSDNQNGSDPDPDPENKIVGYQSEQEIQQLDLQQIQEYSQREDRGMQNHRRRNVIKKIYPKNPNPANLKL